MKPLLILACTIGIAAAGEIPVPAPALTPAAESSAWEFSGAIYAPLMGLEGDIGVAGLATSVDLSFGDILEELDGGATVAFEARRDRWSITGDFIWLKLSASAQPTANSYLGFRQEEIIASLALGYELYGNERTTLDLLAGGALTSMDVDLELFTPRLPVDLRSASGSQEWIDPFVGLRVRHQLSDRWSVWLRGDYGGFGVSSDEYWQVIAGLAYRMTDHTSLAVAYRIIAVDYQQGSFSYDAEMEGPNLGLVFRF
jgi:opacity protein-like surface antigen